MKDNRKKAEGRSMMEVVFILDRSGSMCGLEADTIGGFNATLKKQKETSDNVIWSTVLFDDQHQVIHNRVPISKVKPMTEREYYVRGCTALLDAVGRAIDHIALCHRRDRRAPEKTLFVITTDGMENASREYSYRKVKHMIAKEKNKYGWEFLFLGANMDAVEVAGRMGIDADRAATFLNDSVGIHHNYRVVGKAMTTMSAMREVDETLLDEVREDYARRSGRE